MSAIRLQSFLRPQSNRIVQCARQRPVNAFSRIPRASRASQFRQQRYNFTNNGPQKKTFTGNLKTLWRAYPFSVSLAFFCIACGVGALGYTNYIYQTYIIGAFHKYPEPVAKQLRKALYYTNISLEPENALKYYKEALRVADEVGMHPFSDEILGVKIQVAFLMEKINQFTKAIDVLEIVKRDCLEWIDKRGSIPGNEGLRTKVLGKCVGFSVKLGDLYASPYVMEPELAEERLIWAVETVLKEKKRRETEGVKPEEGDWISDEENGATLEALAHNYEKKDQHYLAAPLFLQALTSSPPNSCHTAVLMNNLSISLAQQLPPSTPGQAPPSRSALVSNARAWAEKAIAVAAKITPPERTEECDVGCAVATHNLGEFAEMDGDIREARKRYQEARALAKSIGFEDGVENAKAALDRLAKT
ncbi:TPR domain-containing protein [Phlyctema vagabunda]|uniref:TPR domain-containing protein n=1 Tax=Phlyctema vagabunda TaxID=108571 RepID=A0ABR4PLQ7_9HELO